MLPQHLLHMMCQLHIQLPPMRSPSISTILQCGIGQQPKRMHGKITCVCMQKREMHPHCLLDTYLIILCLPIDISTARLPLGGLFGVPPRRTVCRPLHKTNKTQNMVGKPNK